MKPIELFEIKNMPIKSDLFTYIIYVHKDRYTIAVEDCDTGKIAISSVYSLNKYIRNLETGRFSNAILRTNEQICVFDICVNDHNAVTELRHCYQFLDYPKYVTINVRLNSPIPEKILKNAPKSNKFEVVSPNEVRVTVPYLATFIRSTSNYYFSCLMFYYDNEFYRFPYGNVSESGTICCRYNGKTRTFRQFFTAFNNMTFNNDYKFPLKSVVLNGGYDYSEFNVNEILQNMINGNSVHIVQALYMLSELTIDQIPWSKILYKVPDHWFESNMKIKKELLNMAKTI